MDEERTVAVLAKRLQGTSIHDFQRQAYEEFRRLGQDLPGARRIVQSLTLLGVYRKEEPVYDVIHEILLESGVRKDEILRSSEFQAFQDSALLDSGSVDVLLTREHVIKDGQTSAAGVKNFEFVTRRADIPEHEFQRYWLTTHGPLAARIPMIRRYVQSHTSDTADDAARWDGLALTWFDDIEAMRASATTDEYARTRADEPNFLAGELPFIITTERDLIDDSARVVR